MLVIISNGFLCQCLSRQRFVVGEGKKHDCSITVVNCSAIISKYLKLTIYNSTLQGTFSSPVAYIATVFMPMHRFILRNYIAQNAIEKLH